MGDWTDLPWQVTSAVESASYLATCDWGYCDRPTSAFAQSDSDPVKIDGETPWLAICKECAVSQFPDANPNPLHPDRVIWISDVERAFGWDDEEAKAD